MSGILSPSFLFEAGDLGPSDPDPADSRTAAPGLFAPPVAGLSADSARAISEASIGQTDPRSSVPRGSVPPPSSATEEQADPSFSISQFLLAEQGKDMLRLSTAGSVDDGKSTLIGRLLYDSRNVYEDHVRSVTKVHGAAHTSIDFAQLTDGLRAEREQGITIDVAYRYFSTERRKFIIADTPGHEQYTRNMATGASTADLAIILIDATKGILTQSRRHVYITSLLGIRHLVAAINKMDLVDFSQEVFERIEAQFKELVGQLGSASVKAIPLSALGGDNVVDRSSNTPWYSGPTLLEHLETVPTRHERDGSAFRLPVQRVIRPGKDYPQPNFRGFAGQIAAGTVHVGDRILALPSGRGARVASITTFDGELQQASAPQSIAISLDEELDISRGDLIASEVDRPVVGKRFQASLVWFDPHPLDQTRGYLLKHTVQTVAARVTAIEHRVNVQTLEHEHAAELSMNEIGSVEINVARPLFFDPYIDNRTTGSFILLDPQSHATVAAGMIRSSAGDSANQDGAASGVLLVSGAELAGALEDSLLEQGWVVVRTRVREERLWRQLESMNLLAIVELPETGGAPAARFVTFARGHMESIDVQTESGELATNASEIILSLRARGVAAAAEIGDPIRDPKGSA